MRRRRLRLRRSGRGFTYVGPEGRRVTASATLDRIRTLAIPPAWTDVWICLDVDGHLQATGRDARGRKQYRYHAQFRAHREEAKFAHLYEFGTALPAVRQQVAIDLSARGVPREKVVAAVVRLLEATLMRVSRHSTIGWGIAQIGVALGAQWMDRSVLDAGLSVLSLSSGPVLGAFLVGVLSRRVNSAAILAGMTTGVVSLAVIWWYGATAWTWYTCIGAAITSLVALAWSAIRPRA